MPVHVYLTCGERNSPNGGGWHVSVSLGVSNSMITLKILPSWHEYQAQIGLLSTQNLGFTNTMLNYFLDSISRADILQVFGFISLPSPA